MESVNVNYQLLSEMVVELKRMSETVDRKEYILILIMKQWWNQ
jgi:hypothetical protein